MENKYRPLQFIQEWMEQAINIIIIIIMILKRTPVLPAAHPPTLPGLDH